MGDITSRFTPEEYTRWKEAYWLFPVRDKKIESAYVILSLFGAGLIGLLSVTGYLLYNEKRLYAAYNQYTETLGTIENVKIRSAILGSDSREAMTKLYQKRDNLWQEVCERGPREFFETVKKKGLPYSSCKKR